MGKSKAGSWRGRFRPDNLMLKYLDASLARQLTQIYARDLGNGEHTVNIIVAQMVDVKGGRRERRLRQSVLARHLVARAIKDELGHEQLQGCTLRTLDTGKPLLVSSQKLVLPAISLAHSGDFVACAWSSRPVVGIDVEWMRPMDWQAVQSLFLHPEEKAWIAASPVEEQALNYYCLWCLKEAFYKCLPPHNEAAMTEFCFSPEHVLISAPAAFLPVSRWQSHVNILQAERLVVAVVW